MAFLALARGAEAINGESNQVSNQVKKLVDGMQPSSKSLAERYDPAMPPEAFPHSKGQGQTVEELWPRLHEQMVKASEEKGQASKDSLQGKAQARYDGETSSELRGQEDGKGKEHLTSYEKQIKIVQDLMAEVKANPDPKVKEHARKLLAEVKGNESSETEQESSEPEHRQLKTNPIEIPLCLDVSPSRFISNGVFQTTDPPGNAYRATLEPFVANNCGVPVTDTQLTIEQDAKCPTGTQLIEGGQNYDVPGPSPISPGQTQEQTRQEVITSACAVFDNGQIVRVYPPSIVDVALQAKAYDDQNQEKLSEWCKWDATP